MKLHELISAANQLLDDQRHREALSTVNYGLVLYPRHPALIDIFVRIPPQYDEGFYESAYSRSYLTAHHFLNHLETLFSFNTIVDVGAGVGSWSHAALQLGKVATSIDGEWVRQIVKPCQKLDFLYQDLNSPIQSECRYDLAICVEVAEHLHPYRGESLVEDLCRLSPVVAFGAALPRQGGVGHINCRPHSYWIALFQKNGYSAVDAFRQKFWYDGSVDAWYAQNTFLFVEPSMREIFKHVPAPSLVDVYHPRVVLDSPICLQDHQTGCIDPTSF